MRPASTLLPGQALVTQQQYEDICISLMTELWTQFGDMEEIWLDGGCGDLCDRVNALVKSTKAANAVAFNGGGGTSANPVRWCGTEGGSPNGYPTIWSTTTCGWCPDGAGTGSPPNATNATWYPSGVDVTLQSGDRWFYTPGDTLHTLTDLAGFYHKSVGANGHLEIDFAISRTGSLDPTHVAAYAAFGAWIQSCYGSDPVVSAFLPAGTDTLTVQVTSGGTIDRVVLAEDLTQGHGVVSYTVEVQVGGGAWQAFSGGVTIGSKRIDLAAAAVTGVTALRVTITEAYAPGHAGVTLKAYSGVGCATA